MDNLAIARLIAANRLTLQAGNAFIDALADAMEAEANRCEWCGGSDAWAGKWETDDIGQTYCPECGTLKPEYDRAEWTKVAKGEAA